MDTHPMVQSNDTLTDCLNGTLITMNGNEVILQNDMGNRRVDKAFLPPGYEPVGMKEYGGVIYVAAYNPITNKSQIGSFPSPQKKLSSTNNGDLEGSFNFDDFFTNYNSDTDPDLRISVINSDSFIIPLTKNINLRAGDKFAVYSEGLSDPNIVSLLTNYNNTSGGNKAYSPKNRRLTLQLGVLNSQNEFVDITKTLCRWKNQNGTWSPVVYDEEKSDIFKFNDGYFISDSFTSQFNVDTIADAQLIKERQKIAANTYSYKLVGPLYLKIILNHIQNFNYNIYGLYDKDARSATLWIEGFLTYNCPDGASGISINNPNGDYATFEEGIPANNFGFDLFGFASSNQVSMKTPSNYNVDRDKCVYNPNTNTYTVKIVRKYENITAGSDGKHFNYVIGVKADKDHSVYLKGLSVRGSIDLTLLGSNQVKYNGWRFHNNQEEGSTLLTFSFEAYPEYGKSFGNLRFKFHNVLDGNNYQDFWYPHDGGDLPMYNGRQTISFNWEENGFKERKIYKVTTEYNIIDNKTKQIESTVTIDEKENPRWLLTTELFNEFYNQPIKTSDYCNVPDDNDSIHKEFYNKMKIKYGSSSSIVDNTQLHHKIEEGTSLISSGELDTTSIGNPVRFIYNNIYNLQVSTNVKLSINDVNLYPDFIHINNNEGDNYIQINDVSVIQLGDKESPTADRNNLTEEGKEAKYDDTFKTYLNKLTGLSVSDDVLQRLEKEEKLSIKFNYKGSKNLTGFVQYNDIYVGKGESIQGISNAFNNFSDLLKSGYCHPHSGQYSGVFANVSSPGLPGVPVLKIYIDVIYNYNSDTFEYLLDQSLEDYEAWTNNKYSRIYDTGEILIKEEDETEEHFNNRATISINQVQEKLYQVFNNAVKNTDLTFLYIFTLHNSHKCSDAPIIMYSPTPSASSISGKVSTRVWWKMPNGQWAMFPILFNKENESETRNDVFSKFVTQSLGKDFIYCMYNKYTGNSGLYAANNNYAYYGRYSIPMSIKINYGFSSGTTEQQTHDLINNIIQIQYNNTNIKCGNLEFSIDYNPDFSSDIIDLNLVSSELFHRNIEEFDTNNISNVYIGSGQMVDSSGELLKSNQFYYKNEKGELEKIINSPFYIDTINVTNDGRNTILYNYSGSNNFPNQLLTFYDIQYGFDDDTIGRCNIKFDKINYVHPIYAQ